MIEITIKKPIDVPTRETAAFLISYLQAGAEVIEVGCGAGLLAAELVSCGCSLVGVDSDPEAIAQARQRGVRVVKASWPEFEGAPVDAVAFTRSLHHIGPLRQAVGRAREMMRPAGSLLVEDFAFDEANEATIHWFLEVLRSRQGMALINPVADEFVTELLRSSEPTDLWRRRHDHELHSITAMSRAIAEHFIIRETQEVPYLYRYLVPVLPETRPAAAFTEDVFREEARLGERGEIVLIGRRLAATPRVIAA